MSKLHIALLFGLGSIAQTSYGEAFDSCPGTAFLMQGTPNHSLWYQPHHRF